MTICQKNVIEEWDVFPLHCNHKSHNWTSVQQVSKEFEPWQQNSNPWVFLSISAFLMARIGICLLGRESCWRWCGILRDRQTDTCQWVDNLTLAVSEAESVWSCAQLSHSWDQVASAGPAVHKLRGKGWETMNLGYWLIRQWCNWCKDDVTLIPAVWIFPGHSCSLPLHSLFPVGICYAAQGSFTSSTGIFGLMLILFLQWTV